MVDASGNGFFDVGLGCDNEENAWLMAVISRALGGERSYPFAASSFIGPCDKSVVTRDFVRKLAAEMGFKPMCSATVPRKALTGKLSIRSYKSLFCSKESLDRSNAPATLMFLEFQAPTVGARVWSVDEQRADRTLRQLIDRLPIEQPPEDKPEIIVFTFWHLSRGGPRSFIRQVDCPRLEEVEDNYDPQVYRAITDLAALDDPDQHGKVIIWHGAPGTGKTYAVRALARAWEKRHGAIVEAIMDPETLFSDNDYMHGVILSMDEEAMPYLSRRARNVQKLGYADPYGTYDLEMEEDESEQLPLRLVIIEDYADLFKEQCRNREGFARFLNLTDGIVGQGVRCVFLLTTNEPIEYLDPAVRRARRCLQILEFKEFEQDPARAWIKRELGRRRREGEFDQLAARLSDRELGNNARPATLADLYQMLDPDSLNRDFVPATKTFFK